MTTPGANTKIQNLEERVSALEAQLAAVHSKLRESQSSAAGALRASDATRWLSEIRDRWAHSTHQAESEDPASRMFIQFKYREAANCLSRRRVLADRLTKCWSIDSSLESSEWSWRKFENFTYLLIWISQAIEEEQLEAPKSKVEDTK